MANEKKVRLPNVFEALLPIIVMAGLMIYGLLGGYYVLVIAASPDCTALIICNVDMPSVLEI